MTIFSKRGVEVASPVNADGTRRQLSPQDFQVWMTEAESVVNAFTSNGGLIYATKAQLDADLAHAANSSAWVIADSTAANNGIYRKAGASGAGSWSRVADLPYGFIKATDVGAGTANAIVATSTIPPPAASYLALILMNVFEANTGAVTVAINGAAAKPLVTNSGNALASGYLTAGMLAAFVDDGTNYRLVTDVASASIIAAAEAAAADAIAAAASLNLPSISVADANSVLRVNSAGTGYEFLRPMLWVQPEDFGTITYGEGATDAQAQANRAALVAAIASVGANGGGFIAFMPGKKYAFYHAVDERAFYDTLRQRLLLRTRREADWRKHATFYQTMFLIQDASQNGRYQIHGGGFDGLEIHGGWDMQKITNGLFHEGTTGWALGVTTGTLTNTDGGAQGGRYASQWGPALRQTDRPAIRPFQLLSARNTTPASRLIETHHRQGGVCGRATARAPDRSL